MAYVMNPNSFKLGHSVNWSDKWYTVNKLYPVMLHIMLTVRTVVYNLFSRRRFEKIDVYLSHVNLGIRSGSLYIALFFYDPKMDFFNKRWMWRFLRNDVNLHKFNAFTYLRGGYTNMTDSVRRILFKKK